jgi:hypothetical protein
VANFLALADGGVRRVNKLSGEQMKKTIFYESGADYHKNIEGWVCKTCRRYWGENEHMARYCCANDFPCKCGKRSRGKG